MFFADFIQLQVNLTLILVDRRFIIIFVKFVILAIHLENRFIFAKFLQVL